MKRSAYLDHPTPIAFAHRGGAYHPEIEGLENTVAAFQHAVGLGYRYLETDVHVTSDGTLLAFHDDALDRVTDRTGAIGASTWAEVQAALIGGRERVPRLHDLLEQFPGIRFNIDLKSVGAAPLLAELLREHGWEDRVLVGAFSARRLREFRRLSRGRVATSAHPLEVAAYLLLPGRVARLLTRGRPVALQVPHRRGPVTVAGPRLLRRAHAAGLHVHVWTIDSAEEMDLLLDRGVDGIFTDRTDILRDVLRARGAWDVPGEGHT